MAHHRQASRPRRSELRQANLGVLVLHQDGQVLSGEHGEVRLQSGFKQRPKCGDGSLVDGRLETRGQERLQGP